MKRIYIAGKINDMAVDYLKNVHLMMTEAHKLRKQGYAIFIPCLDLLSGIMFGDLDYEDYTENDMAWLEVCDELYVLPNWETSNGTKAEIKRAQELGIPITFIQMLPKIPGY